VACTELLLAQLYEAQRNIAMGRNVVEVMIDGERTSFGPGNPALLAALIDGCESDLGLSTGITTIPISTSKGFSYS
jgi:hypothetical protein